MEPATLTLIAASIAWGLKQVGQGLLSGAVPDLLAEPPRTPIRTRYDAGQALDELGRLPPDLNTWLPCPGCADDGADLLVMEYPVTNAQFERFILAGGYDNPAYWGGEDGDGWRWRKSED